MYIYICISEKKCQNEYGNKFLKKIPHIRVCIMNHWDVYTLLYRGLGGGQVNVHFKQRTHARVPV